MALSSRTTPWGYVLAVPHHGMIASMEPGCETAHWNDCSAPIENPATARTCVTPRCSSTRRDASTLSRIAIAGKSGPLCGGGVLLGDDETPLPNISVVTMKKCAGSNALPGPTTKS
jgi:hypothetical protein